MPGLVGFIDFCKRINDPVLLLEKMRDIITHQPFYVKDELFSYNNFYASRSHINIAQKKSQPSEVGGVYCWLDGEFINRDELKTLIKETMDFSDPELLLRLYIEIPDFEFLLKIDGTYSAVILDTNVNKLFLLTDRYGLRDIYWMHKEGQLAWASEIKALTLMPGFSLEINRAGVENLLRWRYFFDDETWFKDIRMLLPSTVLSYDLKDGSTSMRRYWSYDDIGAIPKDVNEDVLIETIAELFSSAVGKCSLYEGRVGLTLSGGLDSRALLAAMPDLGYPVPAVTFGKKGCADVRIAAMVTKKTNASHYVFELRPDNWFPPRFKGVWWTDGQLSFIHMHGIEFMPEIKKLFDVHMNGFAGDAVLGGSFVGLRDLTATQKFNQHVRRFTNTGKKLINVFVESRLPFMSNKLFETALGIPAEMKNDSAIYKKFLLKHYPELYMDIPWQKTGLPITAGKVQVKFKRLLKRIKNKFNKGLRKLGLTPDDNDIYSDYALWLRLEPVKSIIIKILTAKDALYPEWIPRETVLSVLNDHMSGIDHSEKLGVFLTSEIWLQQILNGKYRTYESLF